jgi:flavorubredoxin
VAAETEALGSYFPLPIGLIVPINAFLIRGEQPILVDTGIMGLKDAFMRDLRSLISIHDLKWVWLTHADPDHTGSIREILAEAPEARLVTTFLGMAKLQLLQVPVDRVYLLNPGQTLNAGDRQLLAVRPPVFDAPETTWFFDMKTRSLFSADCFGALLKKPADTAKEVEASELRAGVVTWATVDAPWLSIVDEHKFNDSLDTVRKLNPEVIVSSHLPPAVNMTEVLLEHLASARSAPPFIGPDQAAFQQLLAGQPG